VLNELGEKVPAEIKTEIQAAIEEVKKLKDGEDEPAIRKAVNVLSQAVQKAGVAAYQQEPAQPDEGPKDPEGENTTKSEEKGSE
jgi:molecular chaperone DnaK